MYDDHKPCWNDRFAKTDLHVSLPPVPDWVLNRRHKKHLSIARRLDDNLEYFCRRITRKLGGTTRTPTRPVETFSIKLHLRITLKKATVSMRTFPFRYTHVMGRMALLFSKWTDFFHLHVSLHLLFVSSFVFDFCVLTFGPNTMMK